MVVAAAVAEVVHVVAAAAAEVAHGDVVVMVEGEKKLAVELSLIHI